MTYSAAIVEDECPAALRALESLIHFGPDQTPQQELTVLVKVDSAYMQLIKKRRAFREVSKTTGVNPAIDSSSTKMIMKPLLQWYKPTLKGGFAYEGPMRVSDRHFRGCVRPRNTLLRAAPQSN